MNICARQGCWAAARKTELSLCSACRSSWKQSGKTPEEFLATEPKQISNTSGGCGVPKCQRPWTSSRTQMCMRHRALLVKLGRPPLEEFFAHPRVRPLPEHGLCSVDACHRVDPGPPALGARAPARPPADRSGIRPLRHLRRANQHQGWRPRLPLSVPLHRLRSLPHRPVVLAGAEDLPRYAAENRERLAAATELDDWARTESTPSEGEIKRIRYLIRRVETDLEGLTDDEREQIKEATRTLRKTRTVSLGMPGIRPRSRTCGWSATHDHITGSPSQARATDSERRRARVLKTLDQLAANGEEITVSSVARAAGVHRSRSLIHRHGDLHAAVLARAAEPPPGATTGKQVSRQSLLADVANLTARNGRLSAHITRLERRLSEALGQAAWEASGLGAPADIETLTRQIGELEQQILALRAELAERSEDLAAARAANRELMAQLNR